MANQTMSNATNITEMEFIDFIGLHTDLKAFIVPVIFAVIFIVGTVGNGTLIFIIVRNKKMHTVPNIFILSLACGDLLLILVAVPSCSIIYTFNSWPFGNTMCKVNEFLRIVSLGVSVFNLTALSGDRYVAIVHPMRAHRQAATKKTVAVALGIWVVAFLLAVPVAVSSYETSFKDKVNRHILRYCKVYPRDWPETYTAIHVSYQFCVYFVIPMTIIGVFYLLMARALMRSSREMPLQATSQASAQAQQQLKARKKLAHVVLSFVVIFVLCWLPYHVYMIWFHLLPGSFNLFWEIIKVASFVLSFINSCVNPLALCFLSKQFKHYYKLYLCCFCSGMRHSPVDIEESQNGTMYKFHRTKKPMQAEPTSTTALSHTVC